MKRRCPFNDLSANTRLYHNGYQVHGCTTIAGGISSLDMWCKAVCHKIRFVFIGLCRLIQTKNKGFFAYKLYANAGFWNIKSCSLLVIYFIPCFYSMSVAGSSLWRCFEHWVAKACMVRQANQKRAMSPQALYRYRSKDDSITQLMETVGKVFYGCQHISRGWTVLFSKTHSSWQQKIVAFCLAFSHKQVPDHQEVWVDTTSDRSFNKYTYALNLQQICFVDLNRSNRSMIFPFLVTLYGNGTSAVCGRMINCRRSVIIEILEQKAGKHDQHSY